VQRQVIENACMNQQSSSTPEYDDINLWDVAVLMAENARLLIVGPLAAGFLALGVSFLITPTFTATTRILPPQQQSAAAMLASQLGALGGLAGAAGINIKTPADTHIALIKSRTVADNLIDRFRLLNVYDVKYRDDARRRLGEDTRVFTGKDGLITIDVDDTDPARAAAIANAYVDELSRLSGSLAITEAQQRRVFFEKQLNQTQDQLKKAEFALAEVGAGENLIKSAPQAVVEGIARLKAQLTAQEIRVSTMRGYLTETSPELQLAQRELASLRTQLAQAEQRQPGNGKSPSDYLNRFRDFKYQETLFDLMAKQYELARLDEAREGAVVQVVDRAVIPERKTRPRRAVIAVATTLLAALALAMFVFIRRAASHAAQHSDLSDRLAQLRSKFGRFRPRRFK
jgi:uncharacterized protein involved in exopolysaccharide biosynthesis